MYQLLFLNIPKLVSIIIVDDYIFPSPLHKGKFLRPSPTVIIHPMEKLEGGLTMIEDRAFRELALSAGAREAVLYLGEPLPTHDFDLEKVKTLDIKK